MSRPKFLLAFKFVITTTLLAVLAGIVITRAMPRIYATTALVQIQESKADGWQNQRFDPDVLKAQVEIMRSTPVIGEVVRELNLNEVLGRAYGFYERMNEVASFDRTVNFVKGKISLDIFHDTGLVAITVKLDRPNNRRNQAAMLAADIANQIATTFKAMQETRAESSMNVEIIEPAKLVGDAVPISPNVVLNIMVSVIAGAAFGCVLAFFVILVTFPRDGASDKAKASRQSAEPISDYTRL